jgi:DNA-binding MarR family transcriptional regulator
MAGRAGTQKPTPSPKVTSSTGTPGKARATSRASTQTPKGAQPALSNTPAKKTLSKAVKASPRGTTTPTRLRSPAPLQVDPLAPHIDGEPLLRAEQCIALLQRRLIKPMSRGGPRGELTLTQYHALSFLASRGQASVSELKDILGVAQSTTSVLVDKLARLGLVEKQRDRRDHRLTCVVPLPKGLRMVQRYRKNAERNLLALSAVLGEGAVRDVFVALERALVATAPLEDPRVTRLADGDDEEEADDVDGTTEHPGLEAAE